MQVPSIAAYKPSTIRQIGHKRVVLGSLALALVAAGLAWQWSWLVAVGVAPLLLSVAPCAAMCALGLCMMGMGRRSDKADAARAPSDQ